MSLTQADIEARIARDLRPKYREALVWADIVAAFQALDAGEKAAFVDKVKTGTPRTVGVHFMTVMRQYLNAQAEAEAATLMADGQLSVAELDRWIG